LCLGVDHCRLGFDGLACRGRGSIPCCIIALLLLGRLGRGRALLRLDDVDLLGGLDGRTAGGAGEPLTNGQREANRHRRCRARDALDLFALALLDDVLAGDAKFLGELADPDLAALGSAQSVLFLWWFRSVAAGLDDAAGS
jgi:hypothetical protein